MDNRTNNNSTANDSVEPTPKYGLEPASKPDVGFGLKPAEGDDEMIEAIRREAKRVHTRKYGEISEGGLPAMTKHDTDSQANKKTRGHDRKRLAQKIVIAGVVAALIAASGVKVYFGHVLGNENAQPKTEEASPDAKEKDSSAADTTQEAIDVDAVQRARADELDARDGKQDGIIEAQPSGDAPESEQ
ncbi:MAG: hypothetical protein LBK50_00435 [Candidatus Nomurabacteria bacterium]|jgi:hypothetical protein|nr:hypothetical protein [Candidatus Nomurabacteria bacterium]